jgi:predicted Rossmann fold flavoprotein
MPRSVVIVGGGAAGIYAALGARAQGASATIYERNKRLGIKILISGGGKCNITHEASPRELAEGFIRREARFLRFALHELPPTAVLDALHDEGLETYTRDNGRVFPVSGRAEDVLAAFERMLERAAATVRTDIRVDGIVVENGRATGIRTEKGVVAADAVIVATGGMSYRKVGTTGDGIAWARELGHTVVPVRAALAPIYFPDAPPAEWQGVALRDVGLSVDAGDVASRIERDGVPTSWRDDILLTHRGVSGPAVLEISRAAALAREYGVDGELVVDLHPGENAEQLLERFRARVEQSGRSEVQSFVETVVPRALVPFVLSSAGVVSGRKLSELTRGERTALLATIKRWRVGVVGEVPMDRGEVTAGGVALDEIDPKTMASKRIEGLYVAGEALDIAGAVGGYNLQAAFATGWVAGRAAAEEGMRDEG